MTPQQAQDIVTLLGLVVFLLSALVAMTIFKN